MDRFWISSTDGMQAVTSDGWAAAPSLWGADSVATRGLADRRCLILLGEPGIGKTTAVGDGSVLAPLCCGVDSIFKIDLVGKSRESSVHRAFKGVVDRAGDGDVCLTVDGFDEAQRQIPGLFSVILDYVDDIGPERLWLRVVSRASDWEVRYTKDFDERFSSCESMFLLPLTRANVSNFAEGRGVDPERFLRDVERKGVEAIAARPLTLDLLLRVYERDGALPNRSADLYERGMSALCEELSDDRGPRQPRLVPGRAMEIAARTAAVMAFGGKSSIWLGPEAQASPEDATVSQCVVDGSEWPTSVTPAEVEEVWRGGLFGGTDRRVWAHATFGDYLAARWIATHALSESQVRALLVAEPPHYLYARTRAVAAWLVALSPQDYGWLVDVDPPAFTLGTDVPTDDLRERVVRALLQGDIDLDYRARMDYRTLSYAGLGYLLIDIVPTADAATLDVAAAIAIQCETRDMAEVFGHIALDPDRPVRDRLVAATACEVLSSEHPTSQLVPLATDSEDTRGDLDLLGRLELQGIGLRASVPHAMSIEDVLAVLTPHEVANVHGQHWRFVRDFADDLDDRDAPALAAWIVAHPGVIPDEHFEDLVRKATQILIREIDTSVEIADAAAQIAITRASDYRPLYVDRALGDTPTLTESDRRRLALAVFERATPEHTAAMAYRFVNDNEGLLPPSSLEWLIEHYARARDATQTENMKIVLQHLVSPDFPGHAEMILTLPDNHPAADALAFCRGSCRLDSPEADLYRRYRLRTQENEATLERRKLQINIADTISRFAIAAVEGEYGCAAEAFQLLMVGEDRLSVDHDTADVTKRPGWADTDPETHQRLLDAAVAWLDAHHDGEDAVMGEYVGYWPALVGYRMFIALVHQRPESLKDFPETIWGQWAKAILTFPVSGRADDAADKSALFDVVLPHVRTRFEERMLQVIDAAVETKEHIDVTIELKLLDTPAFAQTLLDHYGVRTPQSHAEWEVLHFLTDKHMQLVRPLLSEQLGDTDDSAREASIRAGIALFLDHPEHVWKDIWARADEDTSWAQDLFGRLAETCRYRAPALTAEHLADLYLWLRTHIAEPDPTGPGIVHFLDRRDFAEAWRNTMAQYLMESATAADIDALNRIHQADSGSSGLAAALTVARRNLASNQWIPLTVDDLDALAIDTRRTPIRTTQDLRTATVAALDEIQAVLQGDTPEAPLLWDTHSKRPKSEDEISDYLRNRLQTILEGAVVNREVQVRNQKGQGMGERTDLRLEAKGPDTTFRPVVLPVEVKGCWHDDLETAWEEQLLNRYMKDIHTSDGVYLVVWFDNEIWDSSDRRRAKAAKYSSIGVLEQRLQQLIAERSLAAVNVDVVVLDASRGRPKPDNRAAVAGPSA
ncbi:NACHT domain-containing protein [Gordonia rhizosphera]|uniref:Uncharacterized protein n=1 Tax=Gordonia rhizosphera NBRC 16068 TaxID=1108045 RepID=K6X2M2_9ACTN|nr:hypothetical protein [Gordonia rhizosphera]GAB93054.1 hypothetical protein GORHZ_203_00140 [Gordonia rhizosphera NBRC 16068]